MAEDTCRVSWKVRNSAGWPVHHPLDPGSGWAALTILTGSLILRARNTGGKLLGGRKGPQEERPPSAVGGFFAGQNEPTTCH